MFYINPYELLGLSPGANAEVDPKIVLREKRRLLQEIELSDAISIRYKGVALTKSDCIRITDDLDHPDKREFHFFIFQNKPLNSFLSSGKIDFFEPFKIESIYKLPEFLNFISPYFAAQYDKILALYLQNNDREAIKQITSVKPITNESSFDSCFKTTYSILQGLSQEIIQTIREIEEKRSPRTSNNLNGIDTWVSSKFNTEVVNLLPSHFQGVRNQLAQAVSNLARTINNDPYNQYLLAFKVIEIAHNLKTDGLLREGINKGYYTIKENYTFQHTGVQAEQKNPKSEKFTSLLNELIVKISELEKKVIAPTAISSWINAAISVSELNSLGSEFDETRTTFALGLRSIAVQVWNTFSQLDIALNIMERAVSINSDAKTNKSLAADKEKLEVIKRKQVLDGLLKQMQQKPAPVPTTKHSTQSDSKQLNGGCFLLIAILVIVFFVALATSNNSSSGSQSNSNPPTDSTSVYTPSRIAPSSIESPKSSLIPNSTDPSDLVDHPSYNPQKMKNGNISGCSTFSPKYDEEINNRLEIYAVASDAAVKIINYETDRCIRFVFINAGNTYIVRHIPQGRYYVKIAYGEEWAVVPGDPKCKGRFLLNPSFKKGEDVLDFNFTKTFDGYSVPSYSLQLNTYSSDNNSSTFSTNGISQSDFESN